MKKGMLFSLLLLLLAVIAFAASTIAYFSDVKQTSNVFTSGNVAIVLSESAITRDEAGNVIADTTRPRVFGTSDGTLHNYGTVYPGQTIFKDPIVTNSGLSDAWVAVKVTITDGTGDICRIMGYNPDETDMIDIEAMLGGGLLDEKVHVGVWNGIEDVTHNDRYAMIQTADARAGVYTFYFLMLEPMQPGDEVMLFDHVTVPREWDNAEMQQLADLKIHVQAFGVQTFQLESCLKAMQQAFPTHFNIP